MDSEAKRLVRLREGCDRALEKLSEADHYGLRAIQDDIQALRDNADIRLAAIDVRFANRNAKPS